jgi:D-xylulose kinase
MQPGTRRVFCGIDCGTQSTKALLLDAESDEVLAVGRASHDLIEADDGTREQDPSWWITALQAAVASALASAVAEAGGVEVAGIGVSGQQHGLVALDAADRPVRPAKLWNDTTTVVECDALTAALGGPEAVLGLTGNLFLPGYTAPKVLWLRRHEPASYERAARFCLPHDYLNLWLTGAFVTEPGDASGTAYFDVRSRSYAAPVLAAIDPARDWSAALPTVVDSLSLIGELTPGAGEALGLPAGLPVSAGGGDNMCAAIGSGAVVEGPLVVSLGTSGTAFGHRQAPAVDPQGIAAAFCDSTGGWLPLACTLNCTLATEWIRSLFSLDRDGFEAALRASPPGARGLVFLPHLAGERTPNVPLGAAAFAGIRAHHGVDDFVRAVAEGVTLGLAFAFGALRRAGLEPSEVTLIGGGAASDAWGQLCADAFDLPVRRHPSPEVAALGAARQARAVVDGTPLAGIEGRVGDEERWEPVHAAELAAAQKRLSPLREAAMAGQL